MNQMHSTNFKFKSALKEMRVARLIEQGEFDQPLHKQKTVLHTVYKWLFLPLVILAVIVTILAFNAQAHAASRIKDIVHFEGIRDNMLIGYGLIVGLDGTGDNLKNSPFTERGLEQFLAKLGINTKGNSLKTKNVAAVTVTAMLPPFARSGSKIDVTVSALGDAKSLQGGTLLATPLLGADGDVYAVAQGSVAMGGLITAANTSNAIDKSVSTSGHVASGAIIEKEIAFNLTDMKTIRLALKNPDISTSRRISESINDAVGDDTAKSIDPGTIEVTVPRIYGDNIIGLLADIEQIVIQTDQVARVVIDEASGTVVIGEDVKIDTVAIAQGNLLVTVREFTTPDEQEGIFALDNNAALNDALQVSNNNNPGNGLAMLRQGANLRDLINGLNALGVGTRDLITILQSIKVAGALHAAVEVR